MEVFFFLPQYVGTRTATRSENRRQLYTHSPILPQPKDVFIKYSDESLKIETKYVCISTNYKIHLIKWLK